MGWTLAISRLSRVKQRCFEVGTWCLLLFITRAGSRFWVARQQPAWEWWRPRAKVQVRGIGRGYQVPVCTSIGIHWTLLKAHAVESRETHHGFMEVNRVLP